MKKLLLLPLLLLLAGCPSSPYRAALQGSDDVASAVHSAIAVDANLFNLSLIDQDEKNHAAEYLLLVNTSNGIFRDCIQAAHSAHATNQVPYLTCATEFVNDVSVLDPATFHFKNAQAQAEFSTYLLAVRTAITGVQLAVQNAGGK